MTKYFTNFEDSSIAENPPTGFTRRWLASSAPANHAATVEYGSPIFKRRQVRYYQAAASFPGMISLDAVDSDADRDDVEVLAVVKRDQAAGVTDAGVFVRGSGAAGAENAYYLVLAWSDSAVANTLYIAKLVAGVATTIATVAHTPSTSKAHYLRFRVNGTTLQGRAWAEDEAEPSSWTVSGTDSAVTGTGWVGFMGYGAAKAAEVNFLSVATNGDTAVTPLSNTNYYAWLDRQDVQRVVLTEMTALGYDSGGSPYTKTVSAYLGNIGYTSKPWDSPANQHYQAAILELPNFRREMGVALGGEVSVGFGSIRVANPRPAGVSSSAAGERDDWLRMKWNQDYVRQYLGDPSWPKHDFRMVLWGRLGQPTAPDPTEIEFPVSDLLGLLDQPFQTNAYTSGPFDDQMKPYLAGRVAFMEPVPTSTVTLEQQIHDGSVNDITDVYDDGVSLTGDDTVNAVTPASDLISTAAAHGMVAGYTVQFYSGTPPAPLALTTVYYVIASGLTATAFKLSATLGGGAINITGSTTGAQFVKLGFSKDLSNGKFTLASNPAGRIMVGTPTRSASASGHYPGAVISDIVFTKYGLSLDHKDQDAFDALDADLPFHCGAVFYGEKTPAIDALRRICDGVNAWYGVTPDGLLQVGRLALPEATAVMSFTEADVKAGSLRLERKIPPVNRPQITVTMGPNFYLNGPLNLAPYKYASLLRPYTTQKGSAWPAAGVPLDDHPDKGAYIDLPTFHSLFSSPSDTPTEPTRLETFYELTLGVFNFQTRLSASRLSIGETIQLEHSRLGWRTYDGASTEASPDNTNDFDATKAVVIGIDTDLSSRDAFPVTLTVFRQIPGYYPTANVN